MGFYLRKVHGGETDSLSQEEFLDLCERALILQSELADDALWFAEHANIPEEYKVGDQRIRRAKETKMRLP